MSTETVLRAEDGIDDLCHGVEHEEAPLLAEQDKVAEEDCQDRANQRILEVVLLVEQLEDELGQDAFDVRLVVLVAELGREEHLADSLDRDLPQHFLFDR